MLERRLHPGFRIACFAIAILAIPEENEAWVRDGKLLQ